MIVDTSGLLAYFDTDEPDHVAVARVIDEATEPLVVSPYIVAELDYLVATRLGVAVELRVLRELASGAWDLPAFGVEDVATAAAVVQRYADQRLSVVDASNVILAGRYATRSIVTLDRRHFEVVRPVSGGRFRILP